MEYTYKNYKQACIPEKLSDALSYCKSISGNTMDLNIMEVTISGCKCAVATIEGMVSTSSMAELVFHPLMEFNDGGGDPQKVFDYVNTYSLMTNDRKVIYNYGDVMQFLFSGFAVVFIDGIPKATVLGIQGYNVRSIDEPSAEGNIRCAKEGFVEVIRTNISLIRRRMKTPALRFKMTQVGKQSSTDVCLAYIEGKADNKIVENINKKLSKIELDDVLTSGYIDSFITDGLKKTIFNQSLITQRPDFLCAMLNEGKVAVLIDGTPFAIVYPSTFLDNFTTMDDYCERPYVTAISRTVRFLSFVLAACMPGIYVATATFHPEMLSIKLLFNLVLSEEGTPYPLTTEMFIIIILFEILREAGIRMPKLIGSTVSIVGGLIIGDAAVRSGLISSPLLIVIGVTTTATFALSSISPQLSLIRIWFILAGGLAGYYGLALSVLVLIINISSMEAFGVAFTSPISPYSKGGLTNTFTRPSFKRLAKRHHTIKEFQK